MTRFIIPALSCSLLFTAPAVAQDPMVARMSDANLTCQQIFDEATQLEARMAEAPDAASGREGSDNSRELTNMAQREAYAAGVDSRIAAGIGMLGGMFSRNAQANAGQRAEQSRVARARWNHLNGLYERRGCADAASGRN